MKKLPINQQNFENIIKRDFLYVDKTPQIYRMIDEGTTWLLSRPRRFGKTLITSVLEHLFKGHKELFKGLYIAEQTDWAWETSPVLSFNFADFGTEVTNLEELFLEEIDEMAEERGIELTRTGLAQRTKQLIRKLAKRDGSVVVTVDEYDKPIIDFLTKKAQAKANRKVLKKFFSAFKSLEKKGHLRFLFITGVSKFNKVSLFSDLNNLTDLTLDPIGHNLVGITNQELHHYFEEHIEYAAQQMEISVEDMLAGIKSWYDGYSYDGKTFLYNPISLFNFFRKCEFRSFWFETGTPTFLVETIRNTGINPQKIEKREVSNDFFGKFNIKNLDIYGLLFQTGYLTIKRKFRKKLTPVYELGYPNEEVHYSFIHNLLEVYTYQSPTIVSDAMIKMGRALENGQTKGFIKQLKILLSDLSYHFIPKGKKKNASSLDKAQLFKAWEAYFQTIIYLISSFLQFSVLTELTRHQGRIDLLIETDDFLYLMEFKMDESGKAAIKQIKSRKYATAYKNSPKTIFLVGVSFSQEKRNVNSWKVEEWKR